MSSSKEEIFALSEIFKGIAKIGEYSRIRTDAAERAWNLYNTMAKNFETFMKKWRLFDQVILKGLIDACDLSDATVAIDLYYNLMETMHEDPNDSNIEFMYFAFAKEISHQYNKASQQWGKLNAKREDIVYDAYQKEMYLKSAYKNIKEIALE